MEPLNELLKEAVAMHGHLCSGQVLGVRMAMVGCREVGIIEPRQTLALVVWVEIPGPGPICDLASPKSL